MRSHPESPSYLTSPLTRVIASIRSKVLNNPASARLSVPPLLVATDSQVVDDPLAVVWRADLAATQPFWEGTLPDPSAYSVRAQLTTSQRLGWFTGLSAKFLACRTAKLLLLAGADRLDTALMVGQMQGGPRTLLIQAQR